MEAIRSSEIEFKRSYQPRRKIVEDDAGDLEVLHLSVSESA
jgi:hypothetical protein